MRFKDILPKLFIACFIGGISFFSSSASAQVQRDNLFFVTSHNIVDESLSRGAITRNDFKGFYEDFLVLHCLVKKYAPKNLFEIGTCEGVGTMILKNALGDGTLYSLDLPPGVVKEYQYLDEYSTGAKCKLPYIQLFGDSLTYNYSQHYPIDSWFIDGEHDYQHVFYESQEALKTKPTICLWHDTDIPEVFRAVLDTFGNSTEYKVYRVSDTRVTFAIRSN